MGLKLDGMLQYIRSTILLNAENVIAHFPNLFVAVHWGERSFSFFRISDRGGGIRHELLQKVWEYGFTSAGYEENMESDGIFDAIMEGPEASSMFG